MRCSWAVSPDNLLYTATISTRAITDSYGSSNINLSSVRVKAIDITNDAGVAQTVTLYKNGNSTTTITAVYKFYVPATAATYSVPLFSGIGTTWSSVADSVDIPYFTVRTSTDVAASAAKINVKYWK